MKSICNILLITLFVSIEAKDIGRCIGSKSPNCGGTVEVGLYFEALCPYSRDFVIQQLYPTFNKLFEASPPILTVNLVPFGNAHLTFNSSATKNPVLNFTCQHGNNECDGNIVESCAVIKYDLYKSLNFITCMFNSTNWRTPLTSLAECAPKSNVDSKVLTDCFNSEEGTAVEYFMAGQTQSLIPKHQYVPWVTINGKHTDEIQDKAQNNLLKLVCDTYPGSPKPKPCDSA
jgi:interferon gamma-inducible protein 30